MSNRRLTGIMSKVLNKYLELEEISTVRKWFLDHGIKKEYKKGDFFIREGEPSEYAGYIESGSFRYIKWNYKNQEQIVGYSFEDDFVTDYGALQNMGNASSGAEAITDSTVWILSRKDLNLFFDNHNAKDLRFKIAEMLLYDIYNRLMSLYVDSPEQRYINLIASFPDILNLVSLKEIASFIKVSPETLSRIRKRIATK